MPKKRTTTGKRPASTGSVRQLPSRRWQARFRHPDTGVRLTAPTTFETRLDAEAWLNRQIVDLERGVWVPPDRAADAGGLTLRAYATTWLAQREVKPRTRMQYRMLLDSQILPELGDIYLDRLRPASVRTWYAALNPNTPVLRAQAYSLLRTIYNTAVADDLVDANPCRIRAAGSTKTTHQARPATLPELEAIVDAMPPRYRAIVLLAAWCGFRFGELTELRRGDVDLERGSVRVTRGVTRVDGVFVVGDPKTHAGARTVAVPPHLLPALEAHVNDYVDTAADALLFPARGGGHMAPASLYKVWYPAREKAGRPDLRFHDLRHTGATLAAATGATLAELMARIGHSTPAAALRYQHAAADRDQVIADALSALAESRRNG